MLPEEKRREEKRREEKRREVKRIYSILKNSIKLNSYKKKNLSPFTFFLKCAIIPTLIFLHLLIGLFRLLVLSF